MLSNEVNLNTAPEGSVFVNNTSYAGCDIKILIHMYNASLTREQQVAELKNDLKKMQEQLTTVEGQITKYENLALNSKPGTPEFFIASGKRGSLVAKSHSLRNGVLGTENRINSLLQENNPAATKTLAEAQTLSLSVFRDKKSVRSCGSVYPKGFTRGGREIAGSLIFTVFNQHVLYEFLQADVADFDGIQYTSALLDQLPPVDITIVFANEYGQLSRMSIYGVEFVSEGQTMSVEDIITENVVSYVARDYDPMRAVGHRKIDQVSNRLQNELAQKASDLIFESDYKAFANSMSPFAKFNQRRDPFV